MLSDPPWTDQRTTTQTLWLHPHPLRTRRSQQPLPNLILNLNREHFQSNQCEQVASALNHTTKWELLSRSSRGMDIYSRRRRWMTRQLIRRNGRSLCRRGRSVDTSTLRVCLCIRLTSPVWMLILRMLEMRSRDIGRRIKRIARNGWRKEDSKAGLVVHNRNLVQMRDIQICTTLRLTNVIHDILPILELKTQTKFCSAILGREITWKFKYEFDDIIGKK